MYIMLSNSAVDEIQHLLRTAATEAENNYIQTGSAEDEDRLLFLSDLTRNIAEQSQFADDFERHVFGADKNDDI